MPLTQHGSHLFCLARFGVVNSYFVRDDDGLTLIDANLPGSEMAILKAAGQIGLPIIRIALTHAHGDHIGSLDALHAALPNAEVSISARDARLLAGDLSLDAGEGNNKLKGDLRGARTRPDRLLQGGDRVGSLWAVAAPGHTPGQLAFHDQRDGTVIAGDAFQVAGGLAVAGQLRPLFPFPALATWDAHLAAESAARLTELNPSRLAVGHGRVLEQPAEAMRKVVREAQRHAPKLAQ
ncbi:MBL fold metallo-hydrolase [Deinococcus rubellus]|uniref:MBL fold metallo-hydrolase n=1 Tax=Deinococcus rubellus TaxID=1889240 RepID=A0ABY5YCS5_9DEIO|nr:MBL fold metallo-hydrolase [Deinococcus rubellus]UWX62864.1 MBL fold metallo-hydrolase [Deinococcus rubellus]